MPPSQPIDVPSAETVAIERRVAGLQYVIECTNKSYPGTTVSLVNVARLVDQVAAARVEHDGQAVLVYGLRLLDMRELDHLVGILDGEET